MNPGNVLTNLRSVVPPAMRPVTARSSWPLVVFFLVLGGGAVLAELMGWMRFTNRWAFLLLLLGPWIWWMHHQGFSGLRGFRATGALLSRLALLGLFTLLLADPRAVRKNQGLSVMYTIDLSHSMGDSVVDRTTEFVARTVTQKEDRDLVGMVVFGREAAVELPPQASFPFDNAINSQINQDGTDIEQALTLSAAMLPEDQQGRIILISDGSETDGNLSTVLEQLKSRRIPVDVLPVDFEFDREVWLERLDLPRTVKLGETYEASAVLSSLRAGSGKLVLEENGEEIYEKEIEFGEGKSRFDLPIYLRKNGYYEYTARIVVPKGEDSIRENNVAINEVFLQGEGRVLLVTDPEGDPRDWQALERALDDSDLLVDQTDAYGLPRNALALQPYDAVAFVNVPADAFDVIQLDAMRDAVYQQGIGFLMVGGKNSFGPGGYRRSAIEEALPVEMDIKQKKILPKGALVINLHTCEFPNGNTWAKRITKQAIRVLGEEDEVGVVAYLLGGGMGAADDWVFELTPAKNFNLLSRKVEAAQIGDMPSFVPSMELTIEALKRNDAALKHMIIITDGDPTPPPPALLQEYLDAKVSISTIVINPHGGQDISKLKSISSATGGRYYFPQNPNALPSIFIKEAKTLKRNMIQNKTFVPEVELPSPILKGMDSLRSLKGYVLTSAKPRSTTILKGPEKEEINPVLSTWRYGTGTTAAFTSDLSSNWAADWVEWEKFQPFVKQLILEISRPRQQSSISVDAIATGSRATITVEDFDQGDSFLEILAEVSGPNERKETVRLRQSGPRRYQAQFPLWGRGRYQILVSGSGSGRSEKALTGLAVPYSPEYLNFRSDSIKLKRIAEETGGRLLTGDEAALFAIPREARESSRPVNDLFLLLLACLIPLDVGLRRIQLDREVFKSWFGWGRKEESGETMGALLRRKKEVQSDMGKREERPFVSKGAPPLTGKRSETKPTKATPDRAKTPSEAGATEEKPMDQLSTTERLLARKRKLKEQNDDKD
ncbi:MAG: VWA domain-containing protein [Verrucomicrobiota bacterium]